MTSPFRDMIDVYDAMIDWPKRLAHEEPFYRNLFARVSAKRVVDVACGTGHHASMFHRWGLDVEGADLSVQMLQRAKARFGGSERLRWIVRGFDQPIEPPGECDVVVCVGNSLALAPELATVELAFRQMLRAVAPTGAVVVQVLNLWHLPDGPSVWQKQDRVRLSDGEVIVVKGVHRAGNRGFLDLIVTRADDDVPVQIESTELLGLDERNLRGMAIDAGASEVKLFGGYRDEEFDSSTSEDLVLVARR